MLFGLLAAAAVPAAIVLTVSERLELLPAAAAIPVALVLGLVALVLGARGRRESLMTLGRVGGDRLARVGRLLGALGVYLALTAALTLAFYGILRGFD